MKLIFTSSLLLWMSLMTAQSMYHTDVNLTSEVGEVIVHTDSIGRLQVNVPPKLAAQFENAQVVHYSDFGARGDGVHDDIDAIAATHAFANLHQLPVRADDCHTYYIARDDRTAVIQTDTDFGNASFIIDDTRVRNREASIFIVSSELAGLDVRSLSRLRKDQGQIDIRVSVPSLITVTDSTVRRYIRFGPNQNNGRPQTDIFIVDQEGFVDPAVPIIWDFDTITEISAIPIDPDPLLVQGGIFTTIANQAESKYNYHSRNILITRSNVMVEGLEHRILGEGDHGAPYRGFISVSDCAFVTIRNCVLTGHKKYKTIGSAGREVSMGSYDISVNRALHVSFINCRQTNDIDDTDYWGIFASNYSKNLLFDSCTFSRFDAHMGVANATIRNSTLGHMGINAIGSGSFVVENTTVRGRSMINLRSDYGSTWTGNFTIRNCVFVPANRQAVSASVIRGFNNGAHDFGYVCRMPEQIVIEDLHIDDSSFSEDYIGPAIFGNLNPDLKDETYVEKFPYIKTRVVHLKNVTSARGHRLRVSDNPFMFKEVRILRE